MRSGGQRSPKEASANGIEDSADRRWQDLSSGKLEGPGRAPEAREEGPGPGSVQRHHRVGRVRPQEGTRRLERLARLGRARILAATLKRVGERWWPPS